MSDPIIPINLGGSQGGIVPGSVNPSSNQIGMSVDNTNVPIIFESSQGGTVPGCISPNSSALDLLLSVQSDCHVEYNTVAGWNSARTLVARKGYIYVYSDYMKDQDDRDIPGFKVGDGSTYLIDLPFVDELYLQHIRDNVRHITQQEREFWNNKVRCYISETDNHNLIFTKQ